MKTQKLEQGEESERFSCESCATDFSVVLEPQMRGADAATKNSAGFGPKTLAFCPFCGLEDIDDNND